MKPVAIFRHTESEGPGHIAAFLEQQNIPFTLIRVDAGDAVPASPDAYAGLVFMGGPMSVNDELPWIPHSLALIRQAVEQDIPVLGHCLGGQLMAKALGGVVSRNPVKEIGWGAVQVLNNPEARAWFGDATGFESFHWHGETFTIPDGAVRILESPYCANQAYVLDGKHLGMQCHVEMTEAMIRVWCDNGAAEIAQSNSPAVQQPATILELTPRHLGRLTQVADRLYSHWIRGLRG